MSENLRRYTQALYALDAVARRVPEGSWDNPSCCEGWTAREVAGHASWVIQNCTAMVGAGEPPAEQPEAQVAGADPAATVSQSVAAMLAGIDKPGVLNRVSATPFGEMPVDAFLGIIATDATAHAWDIADAAGIDHGIDQAAAETIHQNMLPLSEALRQPGVFAEAKEASQGADAVDTLMAFLGRSSVQG